MLIYVDESGSFVPVDKPNRWSVVGAYIISETSLPALSEVASQLRNRLGAQELKFRDVPEAEYVWFLNEVACLPGIAIAQALNMTTSSLRTVSPATGSGTPKTTNAMCRT